eukprot:scaffold967_cov321-Pavlova_lutheri.AAC.1
MAIAVTTQLRRTPTARACGSPPPQVTSETRRSRGDRDGEMGDEGTAPEEACSSDEGCAAKGAGVGPAFGGVGDKVRRGWRVLRGVGCSIGSHPDPRG